MVLPKAARRYARALYDLAVTEGCLDGVLLDMGAVSDALSAAPELTGFLQNYAMPRSARLKVLESVFKPGSTGLTWRFLLFLESKRRMGLLWHVCRILSEIHEDAMGIVEVSLTTAFPLEAGSPEDRAVRASISGRLTGSMRLITDVDRRLIGGFAFRIRDTVYDYSVRGTLEALRRRVVSEQR